MSQNSVSDNNHNRIANLRQRLLRASRFVNTEIVDGLHQHGFTELSSTHTALLSNLDLEGCSLTIVAQRAGMSKQAMGRLADELIRLKYVTSTRSKDDRRAVKLEFTPAGHKLMNHSFAIMEELENRCVRLLGDRNFKNLLTSLQDIADEFENTSE